MSLRGIRQFMLQAGLGCDVRFEFNVRICPTRGQLIDFSGYDMLSPSCLGGVRSHLWVRVCSPSDSIIIECIHPRTQVASS